MVNCSSMISHKHAHFVSHWDQQKQLPPSEEWHFQMNCRFNYWQIFIAFILINQMNKHSIMTNNFRWKINSTLMCTAKWKWNTRWNEIEFEIACKRNGQRNDFGSLSNAFAWIPNSLWNVAQHVASSICAIEYYRESNFCRRLIKILKPKTYAKN